MTDQAAITAVSDCDLNALHLRGQPGDWLPPYISAQGPSFHSRPYIQFSL